MAIPESQLSRWSDHGAQESSKRTHEAIRRVLNAHSWPHGMTYDFYLQGSYRNDTNIRVLRLMPRVRRRVRVGEGPGARRAASCAGASRLLMLRTLQDGQAHQGPRGAPGRCTPTPLALGDVV